MRTLHGLGYTRHFYVIVPDQTVKMQQSNKAISLMLLDIDDFKSINDTYGYLEGDNPIGYIGAQILLQMMPKRL